MIYIRSSQYIYCSVLFLDIQPILPKIDELRHYLSQWVIADVMS